MKKILLTIIFSIITSTVNSQQINGVVQQTNGLIGLWHFNAGTGTTEYDPISKTVMTNNGAWVNGIYGNALSFTKSSSQYATISTDSNFQTSSITVCFWLYYIGGTGSEDVLLYRNATYPRAFQVGRGLTATTAGAVIILCTRGVETGRCPFGYDRPFDMNITKKWVHLAVTYDSKGGVWYLNGVFKESGATYWGGINPSVDVINVSVMPESTKWYVTAYYDELAIFNRAITATEVKAIYNSGKSRVRIKK